MMKKRVCLAAVGLLLLLPASCLGQDAPASSSSRKTENIRHLNVSIAFWDIGEMARNKQPDAVLRSLEERFDITVEPVSVGWTDYEEQYHVMAATGCLPDVFVTNSIGASGLKSNYSLSSYVEGGLIRPLPVDLSPYPRVREQVTQFQSSLAQEGGRYYTIPRSSFTDPWLGSSDSAMLVRKDWMEALGEDDPQNAEDFLRLMRRFAQDDPDRNGKDDTIGYNVNTRYAMGKWVILGLAPECNVYGWVARDGKFLPSYVTEAFDTVVLYYRRLYETGGLDPNFYLKKANDANDDFARGTLGALEHKSAPGTLSELAAQWSVYHPDKAFSDCVKVLPVFPAPDGVRYCNTSALSWSESVISAGVDDEKMERILALYDYLLSEEGRRLTRFGIQGTDYLVDEAGNCRLLWQAAPSGGTPDRLVAKYPSVALFKSLASWGGALSDFEISEINSAVYGRELMEMANGALEWNMENARQVERPYDFYDVPYDGGQRFNTNRIIDDLTRVIIGTGDPVAMWREVVAGYYREGLQEEIEQRNQAALDLGLRP